MRPVRNEDIPELKTLWKKVFGDDDAYVDLFFEDLFQPDGGVVIRENGVLAAMGFLVPMGTYNGRECLVTYAVACDPDYRGKGYGAMISRELSDMAGDSAVICPASKSLFDFYEAKAGYKTEFFVKEYTFNNSKVKNGSLIPVTAVGYSELREKFLKDIPHIIFNERAIRHQKRICDYTGGGLFRVGDIGCCTVERWSGKVIVKELLGDAEEVCNAFEDREIFIRCPANDLMDSRPFAMGKAGFDEKFPLPWFGFAFD